MPFQYNADGSLAAAHDKMTGEIKANIIHI
jgi:hypothetical protein